MLLASVLIVSVRILRFRITPDFILNSNGCCLDLDSKTN